jgi:predicted ATPase
MLDKVTVERFKRFKDRTEFDFHPTGVTYLAGGNNSGKSTLLQALAIWEYARSVIEAKKGPSGLCAGGQAQAVGVAYEEFSPVLVPDLKHLWFDLHSQKPLTIRCDWNLSRGNAPLLRHLEFSLSLVHDRLYIKRASSNVPAGEKVPRLSYLPSFAGMGRREERMSPVTRKQHVGKGLAGSVLRNSIYDLFEENQRAREAAKTIKGRLPKAALAEIRKTDAFEHLGLVLAEVFKGGLSVAEFNEILESTLSIEVWEGYWDGKDFKKRTGTKPKDLMAQGSGFLQWLSVYCLAVDPSNDVLLLDEPDAHLHPALQGHLMQKLAEIATTRDKQVLLTTHSTTVLGEAKPASVYRMETRNYLASEDDRVALFVGLGSQYAPRLDQLKRLKRLFLHDGPSDLEVLKSWARTLAIHWPEGLVCWEYTKEREAREILFSELKKEIPGLKSISLQDRDDYPFAETKADLTFDNMQPFKAGLGLRRWRRRNIENYLLSPAAIARAAAPECGPVAEDDVKKVLENHGLVIPEGFTVSACPQTLANTDGKEVFTKNDASITATFGCTYVDVAEAMTAAEIPDDARTLLQQLTEMCRP